VRMPVPGPGCARTATSSPVATVSQGTRWSDGSSPGMAICSRARSRMGSTRRMTVGISFSTVAVPSFTPQTTTAAPTSESTCRLAGLQLNALDRSRTCNPRFRSELEEDRPSSARIFTYLPFSPYTSRSGICTSQRRERQSTCQIIFPQGQLPSR
jgi:hypothetical protein